jgi:hypothetical protein
LHFFILKKRQNKTSLKIFFSRFLIFSFDKSIMTFLELKIIDRKFCAWFNYFEKEICLIGTV